MYKNRGKLTKRNELSVELSFYRNYQNFNPEFKERLVRKLFNSLARKFSSNNRRRNDTSEHSKQPNKSYPTKRFWGLDFYASVVGPRGSWCRLKILRPLRIRVNRSFSPPHLNESFPSSGTSLECNVTGSLSFGFQGRVTASVLPSPLIWIARRRSLKTKLSPSP